MEAKTKWIIGGVSALALGIVAYVFRDRLFHKKDKTMVESEAAKLADEYNQIIERGIKSKLTKEGGDKNEARLKEIDKTLHDGNWVIGKKVGSEKYTISQVAKA